MINLLLIRIQTKISIQLERLGSFSCGIINRLIVLLPQDYHNKCQHDAINSSSPIENRAGNIVMALPRLIGAALPDYQKQ